MSGFCKSGHNLQSAIQRALKYVYSRWPDLPKFFQRNNFAEVFYVLYSIYQKVLSLSTIVLNSRDCSEIVWLPEILHFKINLAISFI